MTTPGRTRTVGRISRAEQARATKAKLASAALDLFAKQGFAATSTRQIAEAAGVSEGLIFHHYPTKLDLLLGVTSHHEVFGLKVRALMTDSKGVPVRGQLEALAQTFVSTLAPERKETMLVRVLLSEALTTPELGKLLHRTRETVIASIESYLQARIDEEELRSDLDPSVAAQGLLGALVWFFLTHQHLNPRAWRAQSRRYAQKLVDLWLRGALAEPRLSSSGSKVRRGASE